MTGMRIATWNLDRPTVNRRTRDSARLAQIQRHHADIWIFTESNRDLALEGYERASTFRPALHRYGPEEAYASIHSAFPMRPVDFEVFDRRFAVCAEIDSPLGPADLQESYRRAATYVDRIFRGAKPGELVIEQPRKYEMVINMRAAKALGLTIPSTVLGRADEVIQ